MKLIVGLGNPGSEYRDTRHNVGFKVVDALVERWRVQDQWREKFEALQIKTMVGDESVIIAKPVTFMNLSGQAVTALRSWYKLDTAKELIVVYDDMDLPFGKLRLRERGSAGTHNGMRSIVGQLGGSEFPRLRVGIDQAPGKLDAAAYVLSRFSKAEEAELPFLLDTFSDAVELVVREGLPAAMNKYNPS